MGRVLGTGHQKTKCAIRMLGLHQANHWGEERKRAVDGVNHMGNLKATPIRSLDSSAQLQGVSWL